MTPDGVSLRGSCWGGKHVQTVDGHGPDRTMVRAHSLGAGALPADPERARSAPRAVALPERSPRRRGAHAQRMRLRRGAAEQYAQRLVRRSAVLPSGMLLLLRRYGPGAPTDGARAHRSARP